MILFNYWIYDGHSGAPYSWAFGNDANNDGYFRDLAFVPASLNDVEFTADVTQAQKDAFMNYIRNDRYLSQYMGKVFTRNGARANWLNQIDLSIRQEIPGYMQKHLVKAGITGWAQVNDLRGDSDLSQRIQYDLYYIDNWSLWFDLRILVLTLWHILTSHNAR